MLPSCCFCVCVLNLLCLLGLTEILGLRWLHWLLPKMDYDSSGWFQNRWVNETLELHVGDSFRVPKAFQVFEERVVVESLGLWRAKKKKGLHFVAAFVEMEFLYLVRPQLRIALPQGQTFDPLQIFELVGFFSHSLFDPKTARDKKKNRGRR